MIAVAPSAVMFELKEKSKEQIRETDGEDVRDCDEWLQYSWRNGGSAVAVSKEGSVCGIVI